MKKRIGLWAICLTICISLIIISGCSKKEAGLIKIGWIGVLSGDYAYYGQTVKKGTEIAVEEINASGGINGKKIKVIYEDDQLDARIGTQAFQKLSNVDNVPVIIQAAGSSVMLANAPVANKNHIVYLSPTCSSDKIKQAGDYIFRNFPSDNFQGAVLARFSYNKLGARKAAILYINNDVGVGLRDIMKKTFENSGGQILIEETFNPNSKDLRTQLSKIASYSPDIIFFPTHSEEAIIAMRQAKELNINIPFLSSEGPYTDNFLKMTSDLNPNIYISNLAWDPTISSSEKISNFVQVFEKKYGEKPGAYSAVAYDLMNIICKAIESSSEKAEDIKNALYKIRDFPGVTGLTTFDEFGEVQKPYNIYVVKDGKFVIYAEDQI